MAVGVETAPESVLLTDGELSAMNMSASDPAARMAIADRYDLSRGFIVPMLCFAFGAAYGFMRSELSKAERHDRRFNQRRALMHESFDLNHAKLAANPRFADLADALSELSPIDSEESFNRYCREACRLWTDHFRNPIGTTTPRFAALLEQIERRSQKVIQTAWGGMVVTLHEPPRIERLLVIRAGGYFGLEMHEQKDEQLEIEEGAGLILWRRLADQPLAVQALAPGDRFHLEPGKEHCLIGTEDLLVFERSVDPKGMDQDLIFIFESDAS